MNLFLVLCTVSCLGSNSSTFPFCCMIVRLSCVQFLLVVQSASTVS